MGGYKENALVGTAPDASYYLFITEDTASENPIEESLWVEAAEKADSLGVDVINTSLGYFGYDNPNYSHIYADMSGNTNFISKGANVAFSRGMIVVASAGNEGGTSEPHVGAPAEATEVIAVGAVTASKALASFSSIGPSFDGRVKPNIMAQGQAAVLSNEFGNIITASGTSFSGPIMAGMIASLWQAFPNKTNQEIRQLVQASADRFNTPNAQFGYGIPDFGLALGNSIITNNDFVVYPNPSVDAIYFNLPEGSSKGILMVYSVWGQKIIEQQSSSQLVTLSVADLQDGIYFYTFDAEGFSKSGKIIKK
jgi:subtilisin family serine protease